MKESSVSNIFLYSEAKKLFKRERKKHKKVVIAAEKVSMPFLPISKIKKI
jgi:hypothetical protein